MTHDELLEYASITRGEVEVEATNGKRFTLFLSYGDPGLLYATKLPGKRRTGYKALTGFFADTWIASLKIVASF
jgi:hypothetical protein